MHRFVRGLLAAGLAAGLAIGMMGALPAGAQLEDLPIDVPPVTLPPLELPAIPVPAIPQVPGVPGAPSVPDVPGTVTGAVSTLTAALAGGAPSVPGLAAPSLPVPTDPALLGALVPLILADPVGGTCIVVRTAAAPAAPVCDLVQSVLGSFTGAEAQAEVAGARASGGSGATLPFTGAEPWLLGGVAGVLVGLGALALGLRSRSRRPDVLPDVLGV